jgi:hypothetical protein
MTESELGRPPEGGGIGDEPVAPSNRDVELEQLRLEVEQLRSQQPGTTKARRRPSIPWRRISRWTLLVVGGLLVAALGLAVSMVVLLALLAILRNIYLDEVVGPRLPSDAAGDIYNAIVQFVRQSAEVVFAAGVIVAAGAALAGPSRVAVGIRRIFRGGLDGLTETTQARGWDLGPAGIWIGEHRNGLRVGILVGAFLVLLLWSQPTAWVVLGLALIVALLLILVEVLDRTPQERVP